MEACRALLFTAWQTWWDSLDPEPFPLEYENAEVQRPGTGPYGRLSLIPGKTMPASVGPSHERFPAVLTLQIFIPEKGGFKTVTDTGTLVRDFWRYKQLSATDGAGIVTRIDSENVSLTPAGARNGYKQWNVWLNFRCDTFFPT